MNFLAQLQHTNTPLFFFGILCFALAGVCAILTRTTKVRIMNVNAWVKPLKFYLSIALFSWSMGYFMQYLDNQKQVGIYNVVLIAGMAFELLVITMQAARGRQSHFNVTTPLDSALFAAMGVVIVIVNLWTAYIAYLFFAQDHFAVSITTIWSIRLGIIISVVFAFQGGMMGSRLKHTVGGNDDEPGIALLNWKKKHGDLRVAHFLGIHALQVIPLVSLLADTPAQVFSLAGTWCMLVIVSLTRAMAGKGLFEP